MAIYVRDKQGELNPLNIKAIKGKDGITPKITVGEVTTLPAGEKATVEMGGGVENPILNFGIPKGRDGDGVGYGRKLIARYVHNANKSVKPTSLDLATGIFTCATPHGLKEGQQLYLRYYAETAPSHIPVELYELNDKQWGRGRKKVHIINENSFQIYAASSTSDNPLLFSTERNKNVDVSKFSFEYDLKPIVINNIKYDNIEFMCSGFISGGYLSTAIKGLESRHVNSNGIQINGVNDHNASATGQICCYLLYTGKASIIDLKITTYTDLISQTMQLTYSHRDPVRTWKNFKVAYSAPVTSSEIDTFKPVSSECYPLNGFTVEIWGCEI